MCNNENKHISGVSCSACNAFIGFVMRRLNYSLCNVTFIFVFGRKLDRPWLSLPGIALGHFKDYLFVPPSAEVQAWVL